MQWLTGAFLAPAFLGFLALIPVIVLLYLLKLRRTEIVIPSTYLWIKSLQDLTANAPFQRLRKNLLLLLQIIAVLLLAIALGRPFLRAEGVRGSSYCVFIDHSASMQTLEGDKSRLALAQEQALQMADDLKRGDRMMVVAFAQSADVLCELTDDKFRLREAIRGIEPTDTRTNLRDAMLVARSLSPDNPDIASVVADLQLVLLSDGKLADIDDVGAEAPNMTYVRIGASTGNAGIVGFSQRQPIEGQTNQQTFVLVHNEDDAQLSTTLSLYFNDSPITVEEVTAAAGADQEVVFAHPDLGAGVLRVALDHDDALAADNEAWLTLRPDAKIRVLIVANAESTSAYFLKRALALESRVELSTVSPLSYAPTSEYDLVIFDGQAPQPRPAAGTLVYINAVPELPGLSEDGVIERPPILGKESEHPVMRFLNPGNIGIAKAIRVNLPDGARTLLSTTGGPLIADVSQGNQRIVLITFDISDSNWPLELSFPLFVQNLVSWVPRASLGTENSVATGSSITLYPEREASSAIVRTPSGRTETVALDPLRPVYFGATSEAGIYTVTQGEAKTEYAVNLLDRGESSITPADELKFGRSTVAAQTGGVRQTRELWRWFVIAALAVLTAEWWVYTRRAWA